ncbi:carboxypeptidase-like regulatory domain-containing protein [Flavobacterium sp.]|uniref:carboxypeptidase-like regulatory domain-containing protein n=1 Tax=Flavobacterium sp. TaxID=239 RepID=UPI003752E036
MKSIKLISLAITMFIFFTGFGQERIIKGTVSDKNEAIPFVKIVIKGTKIETQTDFDGNFSINVKRGDKLIFSYIGYENFELKIKEEVSEYFIKLKTSAVLLEETYGDPIPRVRKKETYSTLIIKEEEVKNLKKEKSETIIIDEKDLKLNDIQENKETQIIKRPFHRTTNSYNEPLYVIDGFIISAKKLQKINSNNIKSIKVLKGEAATIIYGNKAINGAIIIESQNLTRREIKKLKENEI